jgi:hypothetical protein
LLDQLLLSPALAEACERNKTSLPPDMPLASPSPVQDPGLLLLELSLGQHARLKQLAKLLQLGEPVTHVGWLRRGGWCLRRRDGLGVGLLRLCRGLLRWRWRGGRARQGLVLRSPPGLLPTLNPAVHGAGDRDSSGGLQ